MKISLALGPRRPIDRPTAWGCLTGNLAVPGTGSLIAGRISGYPQLALGLAGLMLTAVFGIRFLVWALSHFAEIQNPEGDLVAKWTAFWMAGRWAFLGMLLFAVGWLWSLVTGLLIVASAKDQQSPAQTQTAGQK